MDRQKLVNPCQHKEPDSMTKSYRPIEGSAVAATVAFDYVKKLHVGQKVRLRCDDHSTSGVVTGVTIREIEVEIQIPGSIPCLLRFDHFGRGLDKSEIECSGPWYIVVSPGGAF